MVCFVDQIFKLIYIWIHSFMEVFNQKNKMVHFTYRDKWEILFYHFDYEKILPLKRKHEDFCLSSNEPLALKEAKL